MFLREQILHMSFKPLKAACYNFLIVTSLHFISVYIRQATIHKFSTLYI